MLVESEVVATTPRGRCCEQENDGPGKLMMETTAVGIGMMMTVVAVAVGGLMLEATLLMLRGAFRVPLPAAIDGKTNIVE